MIAPKNRALIDLNALKYNYDLVEKKVHGVNRTCRIISVVKANAYGHGVAECARTLAENGCDFFAVSSAEEAIELRESLGNKADILILGYTPEQNTEALIKANVIMTLHTLEHAKATEAAVTEAISAGKLSANAKARVHIKLNTGMNRIGFFTEDEQSYDEIESAAKLEHIALEGIFSHFATADIDKEKAGSMARLQLARFTRAIDILSDRGIHPRIRHICNSAGILHLPEGYFNAVRAGIILYGLAPDNTTLPPFRPVMRLEATVSQLHTLRSGESVSYGATYTADRDAEVATLSIGYADGFMRAYSGCDVYKEGKLGEIIGRICMDQCIMQLDRPSVKRGDFVTLFGHDDGSAMERLAKLAKTINYEITTAVSHRVPRIFIK